MIPSSNPQNAQEAAQVAAIAKQLVALKGDVETQDDDCRPEDLPLKKRMFYAAMVRSFGNISQCCNLVGIKRATYRKWLEEDQLFNKLINDGDFENRALDFAESKLMHAIEKDNIIGIMYYLNNKGKKRGYNQNSQTPPTDPNKQVSWFDGPASRSNNIEDAEIVPDEPKQLTNERTKGTAADRGSLEL